MPKCRFIGKPCSLAVLLYTSRRLFFVCTATPHFLFAGYNYCICTHVPCPILLFSQPQTIKTNCMKKFHAALLLYFITVAASSQSLQLNVVNPNGPVNAVALNGNTAYIGGEFDFVGPHTPFGIAIDGWWFIPRPNYPKPNNTVRAVVADGGYIIGGDFTQVDGQPRQRLARINANGTLSALTASFDNTITSLARNGNTLYVGGSFAFVNGQQRRALAAIDLTTGAFAALESHVTLPLGSPGSIGALIFHNNKVYVGGLWMNIGGQQVGVMVELDPVTGQVTWDPHLASNFIFDLAVDGNTHMTVAGNHMSIMNQDREGIGAFDLVTKTLLPFNANAGGDKAVFSIAVGNGAVYAAGFFNNIGGQPRNNLAALSTTTGLATSWNPNPNGSVSEVRIVSPGTILVGGSFSNIAATPRNNLASFHLYTGIISQWNPDMNGPVSTMAANSSDVYAGGSFNSMNGGGPRKNLAAIDVTTGKLTPWNANADGPVNSLAISCPILAFQSVYRGYAIFRSGFPAPLDFADSGFSDFLFAGDMAVTRGTCDCDGGQP